MHRMKFFLSIAIAGAVAGCGGAAGGYGTSPGTTTGGTSGGSNPIVAGSTVNLMDNNSFSPSNLGIHAGQTVTWKWGACSGDGYSGCVSHNVTFDDGSNVASGTQAQGEFTRTFSTPGTYKYHCTIHGAGMSGQVVVQ
jgi:plastocyanin